MNINNKKTNNIKEDMEQYISLYFPNKEDRKNPYASPLLTNDFKKLPYTILILIEHKFYTAFLNIFNRCNSNDCRIKSLLDIIIKFSKYNN